MGVYSKGEFKVMGYELKKEYCIWLGYMHILAVGGLIYWLLQEKELFTKSLYMFLIFHVMGGLGITAGSHRLWAHRSYTAKTPYRILVMLFNSMAFQGSIFHWSRDHRLHHKFSDTDIDPHSMNKGFFFAHVGWLLVKKSPELKKEGEKLNIQDLLDDPVVMFQKKHYFLISSLVCFIIPTIIMQYTIGGGFIYNFLMSCFRYVFMLHTTWCVNSVCHMFGSRPYNESILPTENLFVSIIALGEGWHNWHHEYPRDWRAAENKWTKINFTSGFIKFFEFLGQCDTNGIKKNES
ncbi:hypothetical protein ABPG74_009020 [Tetrahymena malaccensis]